MKLDTKVPSQGVKSPVQSWMERYIEALDGLSMGASDYGGMMQLGKEAEIVRQEQLKQILHLYERIDELGRILNDYRNERRESND